VGWVLQCNPLGVLWRGMLPINLVSIFRCSSPPHNPVYTKRVDLSLLTLVFHHTDTHSSVFYLALTLSFHNKQIDLPKKWGGTMGFLYASGVQLAQSKQCIRGV
jgi:hypothetical protein